MFDTAGCPNCAQPWCETLPAITSGQMITGFALIVTGFPMGASMGNAIFSKILGPFPQVCLTLIISVIYYSLISSISIRALGWVSWVRALVWPVFSVRLASPICTQLTGRGTLSGS